MQSRSVQTTGMRPWGATGGKGKVRRMDLRWIERSLHSLHGGCKLEPSLSSHNSVMLPTHRMRTVAYNSRQTKTNKQHRRIPEEMQRACQLKTGANQNECPTS